MATKLYVVCEYGWEYNDDYYYQDGNNGSEPRKAYKSKEKAQADCLARNVASVRDCWLEDSTGDGLRKYVSDGTWDDLADVSNHEALFKLFNAHDVVITHEVRAEWQCPETDLPDEFFNKLTGLINLSFYCVVEIEAELR